MASAFLASDLPARFGRPLQAGLALVVLAAAGVYGLKASENASAIIRWRDLIQSVARGENVYNEWTKDGSFPYPPFAGLVLWPLTAMPPLAAAFVWFGLKVMMVFLSIRWSIELARDREQSLPIASLLALLALVSRPILSDLQHGNINILILFLVTAGLVAFRHEHDWLAGTMIALATAIKLTPALFIPYFMYKRQWRVTAWSVAGLLTFLLVVPGIVLGLERNAWLLRSWSGAMVEPYLLEGKVETLQTNQSLPGIWFRLVTDSPGLAREDGEALHVNWLSLDTVAAGWILKGLLTALVVGIAWLCRGAAYDRGDWRWAAHWSLVFIAMLLVSERSWKHHFVTMTLPYAVAICHRGRPTCHPRLRAWLTACLVFAFLLMASTSTELGGWIAGCARHKYAQAYGMFAASALVMLSALAAVLQRGTRQAPQS